MFLLLRGTSLRNLRRWRAICLAWGVWKGSWPGLTRRSLPKFVRRKFAKGPSQCTSKIQIAKKYMAQRNSRRVQCTQPDFVHRLQRFGLPLTKREAFQFEAIPCQCITGEISDGCHDYSPDIWIEAASKFWCKTEPTRSAPVSSFRNLGHQEVSLLNHPSVLKTLRSEGSQVTGQDFTMRDFWDGFPES